MRRVSLVVALGATVLLLLGSPAVATTPTPDPDDDVQVVPAPTGDAVTFPVQDIAGQVQDLVFPQASVDGAVTDRGDGDFSLASDVLFDFDRSDLKPRAREEIARIAGVLRTDPRAANAGGIDVVGYTDSVGDDAYNRQLSQDRAESVRAELAAALGPGIEVRAAGRGETEPVADNRTEAGQALNRRVEISIGD